MIKQQVGLYAGTKIPQTVKNAMKKAVITGKYLNASDFIRDAIKEKLQREGYLVLRYRSDQRTPVGTLQSGRLVNA